MADVSLVSRTSTIALGGSFDQVFPLFGPVREREWAEGWAPRMLYPESEDVQERMVFQAEAHDPQVPSLSTWIVSKFNPAEGLIEYTVFTDARIWWITIQCGRGESPNTTRATITYAYLGLNPQAIELNETALDKMFRHELKDWELAINHYLSTGARLNHPHAHGSEQS